MEKYFETNVSNNQLTFKYVGEFEDYQTYINDVFNHYDLSQELNISYVFSESELTSLKEDIKNKINEGLDPYEFFGFRTNRKFVSLGFYNNEAHFEACYYNEDYYGFSMASDGVFYGNVPILKNIVEIIETTIQINNISNEDVLSYFNDNQNIKENDL